MKRRINRLRRPLPLATVTALIVVLVIQVWAVAVHAAEHADHPREPKPELRIPGRCYVVSETGKPDVRVCSVPESDRG